MRRFVQKDLGLRSRKCRWAQYPLRNFAPRASVSTGHSTQCPHNLTHGLPELGLIPRECLLAIGGSLTLGYSRAQRFKRFVAQRCAYPAAAFRHMLATAIQYSCVMERDGHIGTTCPPHPSARHDQSLIAWAITDTFRGLAAHRSLWPCLSCQGDASAFLWPAGSGPISAF